MNQSGDTPTVPSTTSNLDSDYDMSDDDNDPTKPWFAEFERYLMTHNVVSERMSIVEWWGVCLKTFTSTMIDTHTWLFS